jgi:hypothetical protein
MNGGFFVFSFLKYSDVFFKIRVQDGGRSGGDGGYMVLNRIQIGFWLTEASYPREMNRR